MTISYEEIFDMFLGSVTDYKFVSMNDSDFNELLTEYLQKVISKSYIRRLFSSFNNDKEIMEITCEMDLEEDEDSDRDFVIDILAKGLVVEWLQPQVKNVVNTTQLITSNKESKFYSQQSHLSELRALLEDTRLEQRKLIRDRGYINNDYLEGKT